MLCSSKKIIDWVWTELSALAGFAMLAHPYFIELGHGTIDDFGVIGQDARLEVAFVADFHANAGTSEISTTYINLLPIEHKHLEMNTRTKHTLQAVIQHWVLVKILPKVQTRFFCMNEPYLHATPNELSNKSQNRLLLFAHLDINVFYVSRSNPKSMLHGLNP